ncbi:hypothetical protein GGR50DRAFT_156218 [Xylaria sp. CBS 124048]|nr:hypothetical protein GGR50DRAFT_156218 [Xylaria sp. CBS 124048]
MGSTVTSTTSVYSDDPDLVDHNLSDTMESETILSDPLESDGLLSDTIDSDAIDFDTLDSDVQDESDEETIIDLDNPDLIADFQPPAGGDNMDRITCRFIAMPQNSDIYVFRLNLSQYGRIEYESQQILVLQLPVHDSDLLPDLCRGWVSKWLTTGVRCQISFSLEPGLDIQSGQWCIEIIIRQEGVAWPLAEPENQSHDLHEYEQHHQLYDPRHQEHPLTQDLFHQIWFQFHCPEEYTTDVIDRYPGDNEDDWWRNPGNDEETWDEIVANLRAFQNFDYSDDAARRFATARVRSLSLPPPFSRPSREQYNFHNLPSATSIANLH